MANVHKDGIEKEFHFSPRGCGTAQLFKQLSDMRAAVIHWTACRTERKINFRAAKPVSQRHLSLLWLILSQSADEGDVKHPQRTPIALALRASN